MRNTKKGEKKKFLWQLSDSIVKQFVVFMYNVCKYKCLWCILFVVALLNLIHR